MGKNIVILSDGTNQIGGVDYNTNVYKLFNIVEDRTDRQVVYYDPGIGTDWRGLIGAAFGFGFSKNIQDCYRFLFENFEADDEIYLFGFSRGAATVRSLSGFIHLFGILPQSRPDLIRQAYKIYKIRDKTHREKLAKAFINKHHTMWCKIKFLGVFDTVAALGLPAHQSINPLTNLSRWLIDTFFPHKFHSFGLSDSVSFARQALSIDDEREPFQPVLWDPLLNDPQGERMKQVWFCGVHTDVGGGYKEEDLSNISLQWMIREATAKGLIIYEKAPAYQSFLASIPNVDGTMHNERASFFKKLLYKRKIRSWNEATHGVPCIHESVLKRNKNNSNIDTPKYSPWILNYQNRKIEA